MKMVKIQYVLSLMLVATLFTVAYLIGLGDMSDGNSVYQLLVELSDKQ